MKHRTLFATLLALAATIAGGRSQEEVIFERTGAGNEIAWWGEYLRSYQVEVSPDLLNWGEIGPVFIGAADRLGYLDQNNDATSLYYRVREGAMRPGFDDVEFGRNDDKTYPNTDDENSPPPAPVNIGFPINFYDENYTQCYVNNNGNISFGQALSKYTPENLGTQRARLIAPFWADVDTLNPDSGLTRFSSQPGLVEGRQAFGVTWRGVGYFSMAIDKNNSFQMLLIDRSSDFNAGDFDIEFNYNQIQWETGNASGGNGGLGGSPARAGLANGSGRFLEYKGSGESLAFLDQQPGATTPNYLQGLRYQMLNSTVPGRLVIQVRNGTPVLPGDYFEVDAGTDRILLANDGSSFSLQGEVVPYDTTGVSYTWEQDLSNSAPVAQIVSPGLLFTTVNIPEPDKKYIFRLTGTRPGTFNLSASDTVEITHPGILVVKGGEYNLPVGSLSVMLAAAEATFNGQDITAVQWTKVSGGEATIDNPNLIHPTIQMSDPDTYEFEITATTNTSPAFVKKARATVILAAP